MLYDFIEPLHEVRDEEKVARLTQSMEKSGWIGLPVLTVDAIEYEIALTGTHRIAAASCAGIDVPTFAIDQEGFESEEANDLMRELLDACGDDDRFDVLVQMRDLGLIEEEAVRIMSAEVDGNVREQGSCEPPPPYNCGGAGSP